ncbi:MAG: VTT domain-containing protein [Pseudomonadota bacterium]|nr:VTT domain-containing protein [Pseudomonadota bacterium]
MTELLQDLLAWVSTNPTWAHLAVFLVALVESLAVVGLIVPGVIMMLGAGALIAAGALEFWPVCLWAIAGAVAGDGLSYWLGRHFQGQLKTLWPFSRYPDSLESGVSFFEKYGGKSVAFGRFVGPVRAVIPLVAGMMGMSPGRFLVANVLSAIAWAPAYLLPGIVFGASLELAAEAALRLVLLVLSLVVVLWLVAWAVQQLFLLFSPRAGIWVQGLLRWAEVHPRVGEIARALADPSHPDAKTLAALAAVLLLATLLFALVTGVAIAGAPELGLNRLVLNLGLSLHAPPADHLMAVFSRLADLPVILPLVLVVWGWLLWRDERRHANYWLAAGAFGLLAGPLLKILLQVPRPDIGLTGLSPWAFPSSHVLRATVVYGFLAVSLASSMTPTWRWLPYVWATLVTVSVAISRLYFGAHWLTDVLGSFTLGLAWVAALGLAFRRHTEPSASRRGLGAVALVTFVLAFGVQSMISHRTDLALYSPQPATVSITETQWRSDLWRNLPSRREDLRHLNHHPMSLQYAGSLDELTDALADKGWERGTLLGWANLIKLLSPSLPLQALPVIPHVHDGHHESLTLVKHLADDGRLVLRLWATPYRIGKEQTPLWVGNVTGQQKKVVLDLIVVPATDPESSPQSVNEDFAALQPSYPTENVPLLLQMPPKMP